MLTGSLFGGLNFLENQLANTTLRSLKSGGLFLQAFVGTGCIVD